MKYDYPITINIINKLKEEYRQESIDKCNSWRTEKTIDDLPTTFWLLHTKLQEEFLEIKQIIERIDYNEDIWNTGYPRYKGLLQSELIDLILVACMAYERIERE